MTFIASDRTNYNTYIDGSYICHDFSYDLKRNAFDAGYHCLYVAIEMGDYIVQQGHALIAFNTTDRGLIYIEPQSDQIMDVKVGQHYWDRAIYEKPDYDDTITKIEFIP